MTIRTICHWFRVPVFLAALPCLGLPATAQMPARPQPVTSSITVETSPQLFATMCALDVAGFDANSNTLDIYPADAALRARLLQLKGPAAEAMRQFYGQHQFANSDETLSPFLSFALVVGPPPRFRYLISHDEIPPAVLSIDGFGEILSKLYVEAQLDREWAAVEPEVDREVARLTSPVRQIVFQSTAYLREIQAPGGRTFTVLVEPLVGQRVNFRNIGNHYSIIVGPGPDLPLGDIRHAMFHFLLDPLTLKYQQSISTRRALLEIANRAPQLPTSFQDDFVGLFDECMVRAVELRVRRLPAEQIESALAANDKTGFILVRPIYQQLIVFEKSEPAMSLYFPSLVQGINVAAEQKRLRNFAFASASEKVQTAGISGENAGASAKTPLDQEYTRGDRQIALQDANGAAATFQGILNEHPNQPRALYGLALASVLQGQGEKAENLFEQIVSMPPPGSTAAAAPSPSVLAWSHVYLGRIRDLQGEREPAIKEYRAALGVGDAPEAARVAAHQGIDKPYHPAPASQPQ
ncbi:MAG TPA: tetratricopeptide repeat protein [Candidatus Acidoferrales bacterium]|nr:tetratricopeptide repeat protein [Candidatus Acidoferrales bacterium]